jgi:hypothetical protein
MAPLSDSPKRSVLFPRLNDRNHKSEIQHKVTPSMSKAFSKRAAVNKALPGGDASVRSKQKKLK